MEHNKKIKSALEHARAAMIHGLMSLRAWAKRKRTTQVLALLRNSQMTEIGHLLALQAKRRRYARRPLGGRVLSAAAGSIRDPVLSSGLASLANRSKPRGLRYRDAERIIVFERSGMRQDLEHGLLAKRWDGVLLPIRRQHLKQIAESILEVNPGDFNYLAGTSPEARARLRAALSQLLAGVFVRSRARTVLTANIAYWADQELPGAAHESGGKLLVLHKESLMAATQSGAASYVRALRHGVQPSPDRGIAVYAESTAQAIISSGVASKADISVVGAARLDAAHAMGRQRSRTVRRHMVTFFSFSDWIGISFPADPEPVDDESPLRWTETIAGFNEAASMLAEQRPDISVIIKHKSAPPTSSPVPPGPAPSRLGPRELASGADALTLVRDSAVCIAFNSTVVLEALAARVPVIVPAFGEAAYRSAKGCIIDFGPTVFRAESPEQMVRLAARFVDYPSLQVSELTNPAREALDRLAGNPDGLAGERLGAFIAGWQAR